MKKILLSVLLIVASCLLSACNNNVPDKNGLLTDMNSQINSSQNNSDSSQNQNSQNTDIKNENKSFRMQLSVCSELPTEYNGKPLSITTCVKNAADAFDFTYLVFVNGIKADYTLKEQSTNLITDTFHVGTNEEIYTIIEFSPLNCKAGEKAVISVELMIDPKYMLPDTNYVSFTPHHNITGLLPFEITIKNDSDESKETICDISEKEKIDEGLRSKYDRMDADGNIKNLLSDTAIFNMTQKDHSGIYMICDDTLKLDIEALGKEGKYIVGVYINHKLQKAFGESYYCICDIQDEYVTRINAEIDTSALSGLNHIYIMAVPYATEELSKKLITQKLNTKLLQIEEGKIAESEKTENKNNNTEISKPSFESNSNFENENNPDNYESMPDRNEEPESETESKIETSSTQNNNKNDKETGYIIENTELHRILAVQEHTLIVEGFTSVFFYNKENGKLLNEIPKKGGDSYSIYDNGLAVYEIADKKIKLYDYSGNKTNEIAPPVYDSGIYRISNCGTKIAYSYTDEESGICYLYTDDISGNNKKLICSINYSDIHLTLQSITRIESYDGENIVAFGQVLYETDPERIYRGCVASIDSNGKIEVIKVFDEYEILSTNYALQDNFFVITEGYKPDASGDTSGIISYCSYDDNKIMIFKCEEQHDNHFAYLSSDGKTIATANPWYDGGKVTVKFFDTATNKKLFEKEFDTDVFDIKLSDTGESAYILMNDGIALLSLS